MDAEVGGFLHQQHADAGLAFHVHFGHVGFFVRPGAVMEQVEQFERIERIRIFLLCDLFPVDGTKIAAVTPAAVHARWGCAPVNEGDDREGDDHHPQPFRMFANCSNHSEK